LERAGQAGRLGYRALLAGRCSGVHLDHGILHLMSTYPTNYLLVNDEQSKQLNVVLEIDGLDFKFGLSRLEKEFDTAWPG
jgi:hypothetical protein